MRIPEDKFDEVVNLFINTLYSEEDKYPFREANKICKKPPSAFMEEIIPFLEYEGIIHVTNNKLAGRLTPFGMEIKRKGGWLKHLERKKEEEQKTEQMIYKTEAQNIFNNYASTINEQGTITKTETQSEKKGLSKGDIIGIVSIVVTIILGIIGFMYFS